MKTLISLCVSAVLLGACASVPDSQKVVDIEVTDEQYQTGTPVVLGSNISTAIKQCVPFKGMSLVFISTSANHPGVSAMVPTMSAWVQGDQNCEPIPGPGGTFIGLSEAQAHNVDIRQRGVEGAFGLLSAAGNGAFTQIIANEHCEDNPEVCSGSSYYFQGGTAVASSLSNSESESNANANLNNRECGGGKKCGSLFGDRDNQPYK